MNNLSDSQAFLVALSLIIVCVAVALLSAWIFGSVLRKRDDLEHDSVEFYQSYIRHMIMIDPKIIKFYEDASKENQDLAIKQGNKEIIPLIYSLHPEMVEKHFDLIRSFIDDDVENVVKFRQPVFEIQDYAVQKWGRQVLVMVKDLDPEIKKKYAAIASLKRVGLFR